MKTTSDANRNIVLALTGASVMPVAIELIRNLLAEKVSLSIVYSEAAKTVMSQESTLILSDDPQTTQQTLCHYFNVSKEKLRVYANNDWSAPMASGSGTEEAMIICPASMGTVSAIAHGASDDLLTRAADVMIKEKKPLILVPREAPLSAIHLENLLKLAQVGATIIPAMMTFYHQPKDIGSMIDILVCRILNHLGILSDRQFHWGHSDQ